MLSNCKTIFNILSKTFLQMQPCQIHNKNIYLIIYAMNYHKCAVKPKLKSCSFYLCGNLINMVKFLSHIFVLYFRIGTLQGILDARKNI